MAGSASGHHHGGVGTSYSYAIGPIMAFLFLGVLILILRWAFRRGASVVAAPPRPGSTEEYGLLVPIATAYGHCRRIHGELLAREVRSCPSMEGAFVENISFGRSVGKEFRGMGTWSAETCVLEPGEAVDPAGKLTADEVAKARRVCAGAGEGR